MKYEEMIKVILAELAQSEKTEANLERRLRRSHLESNLHLVLQTMCEEGSLIRKGNLYALHQPLDYKTGIIKYSTGKRNIYTLDADGTHYEISLDAGMGALPGDKVQIKVENWKAQERNVQRPHVVQILERRMKYVVGTVVRDRNKRRQMTFIPDNALPFALKVDGLEGIAPSTKVLAEITAYPSAVASRTGEAAWSPLQAQISRVIGKEGDPDMGILSCLYAQGIDPEFPEAVCQEAAALPQNVTASMMQGRKDLRQLLTVTIDGKNSKDFDDAISIVPLENEGWKLYVHIADVAAYVPEGSALDREARKRGTSVYAADLVVPMLPSELSNGICSLNPQQERLALTCEMDFDAHGIMSSCSLYESVIRSDRRCCYESVNLALDGDPKALDEYDGLMDLFAQLSSLASLLKEQRSQRGALVLKKSETVFVMNENREPEDVYLKEKGWAEWMIEAAMSAANTAVAHILNTQGIPGLYRVHAAPDNAKKENLVSVLDALGVVQDLNFNFLQPGDIQRLLDSIEDEELRETMNLLVVKNMMKAAYSQLCSGHYGLALPEYCQFTSPIRRYPDLVNHRMLKQYLIHQEDNPLSEQTKEELNEILAQEAFHLSQCERTAEEAVREAEKYLAAWYADAHVGEEYEGILSGVQTYGVYVELPGGIEGLIPSKTLNSTEDEYLIDTRTHSLVNTLSGEKVSLGQRIRVCITRGDRKKRQVSLMLSGGI